jgi:hypothetical protein
LRWPHAHRDLEIATNGAKRARQENVPVFAP